MLSRVLKELLEVHISTCDDEYMRMNSASVAIPLFSGDSDHSFVSRVHVVERVFECVKALEKFAFIFFRKIHGKKVRKVLCTKPLLIGH